MLLLILLSLFLLPVPGCKVKFMKIEVVNEAATADLAGRIARAVSGGMTIGLTGELGAGKTTFVRYFCSVLGVRDAVSSPTYVLEHEYRTPQDLLIEHWDLYRLSERPEELFEAPRANTIRIIEWIDRVSGFETETDLIIDIRFGVPVTDPEQRVFYLGGTGLSGLSI